MAQKFWAADVINHFQTRVTTNDMARGNKPQEAESSAATDCTSSFFLSLSSMYALLCHELASGTAGRKERKKEKKAGINFPLLKRPSLPYPPQILVFVCAVLCSCKIQDPISISFFGVLHGKPDSSRRCDVGPVC